MLQMEMVLERTANALDLSEEDLIRKSLRLYLKRQLRRIQADSHAPRAVQLAEPERMLQ